MQLISLFELVLFSLNSESSNYMNTICPIDTRLGQTALYGVQPLLKYKHAFMARDNRDKLHSKAPENIPYHEFLSR